MFSSGHKIEKFEDLLVIDDKNITILEEEIDLDVQQEYFTLVKLLFEKKGNIRVKNILNESNLSKLYAVDVDNRTKKVMLIALSMILDVKAYRVIEEFTKYESELQKWSVIALQQSRIRLKNYLSGGSGVFISSGLGGKGSLLRYFSVIFFKRNDLADFQKDLFLKELHLFTGNLKGEIEDIAFEMAYASMTLLLPIKLNLPEVFAVFADECNEYGDFVDEQILITNTHRLSVTEIAEIEKDRQCNPF